MTKHPCKISEKGLTLPKFSDSTLFMLRHTIERNLAIHDDN